MVTPISSTKLVKNWVTSNKNLVAWDRIWSNMKVAKVIDPSVFSNWIYEKITADWPDKWKLTKVVNSDQFVEKVWWNYYDTNHGEEHDILLWDENSVYMKCPWQNCINNGWVSDPKYYKTDTIKEIPFVETRVSFDSNTKLKIADFNQEVKNWRVVGQSYDTLSFSWLLDADADAYLIKLVERIDHSYEKAEYSRNGRVIESSYRYVLALPEGSVISDSLKLELLKKKVKSIKNIDELVQIVYYNDHKDIANIVLSNIKNIWYYARICTLNLNWDTYDITSPWSNQIVAWRQVVWDDQPPVIEQTLFRPSIPETISEWDDLEWFVWTNYKLNVKWKDNVALSYISISKNWRILAQKYTSDAEDILTIDVWMHFKADKEFYDLLWIDQFWNKIEKTISISYYVPDISITNVSRNADWETVTIFAELSHDMDQWNVSFQRRRWNVWKTMDRRFSDSSDILLVPWNRNIVWSGYSVWNDIAMYGKDNEVIALMDPTTAEIKFQSGYENFYDIKASVTNSAVLNIYDKNSGETKFLVSLPTKRCVKVEADSFDVVDLPENWRMWMFNWGFAVHKDWDVVLIGSPTCHLYSELSLQWSYSYDREKNAVLLILYQPSDIAKSFPIKVWVEIAPFLAR